MVHRDVTPDNIVLGENGSARLTDFDLVRTDDTTGGTKSGHVLGKFLYMSPELFDSAQEADPRSDVYSLGMTATFALHGTDLPRRVVSARERFFSGLSGSEAVRGVLYRATAEEPGERYGSAAEMCRALDNALHGTRTSRMPTSSAVRARRDAPGNSMPMIEAEDTSRVRLAGIWKNTEMGSTYVMRVVNGKVRCPYCHAGDRELTGEYYDWRRAGDSLIARFRWFDSSIAGYAHFIARSMSILVGGWWNEEDVPEDLVSRLPMLPGIHPNNLIRQKDSTPTPAWAEAFFRALE